MVVAVGMIVGLGARAAVTVGVGRGLCARGGVRARVVCGLGVCCGDGAVRLGGLAWLAGECVSLLAVSAHAQKLYDR